MLHRKYTEETNNTEKSDIYSFGIIVWEILTGKEPQLNLNPMKMAHLAATQNYRPPFAMNTAPSWQDLTTSLWAPDPSLRPSFSDVLTTLRAMQENELLAYQRVSSSPPPSPSRQPSPSNAFGEYL